MESHPDKLPRSSHFEIQKVAEGVYGVVASAEGHAVCNSGIVDLGDKTVVFDTFISPTAAQDLRRAAETLTQHEVDYVVNSHYHEDHIRGNQAFSPKSDIISTTWTREAIIREEPEEIAWEKENVPRQLVEIQAKLRSEHDPRKRRELSFWLGYYQAMMGSHANLKTTLPNVTFDRNLTIRGTRRTVDLRSLGCGHTGGDLVLYLPEDQIAFMADLLFIGVHPYLPSGSPDGWVRILNEVKALGVKVAVPGHGPVGRASDLTTMVEYIQTLKTIAVNMVKAGKPAEDVAGQPVPPPYDTWLQFPDFFATNLKFMHSLVSQGGGKA